MTRYTYYYWLAESKASDQRTLTFKKASEVYTNLIKYESRNTLKDGALKTNILQIASLTIGSQSGRTQRPTLYLYIYQGLPPRL